MKLVPVFLAAGLAMASAQCGYLLKNPICNTANTTTGHTDCYGEALAQGACSNFGPFSQGMDCNAAGDMMILKSGTGMCNGSAAPATITSLGKGRCGSSCYAPQSFWLAQNCGGTAFGLNAMYTGGDCWNGKKVVCDSNWLYEYQWDPADAGTCPQSPTKEGSVTKFPINRCVDFSFPGQQNISFKVASCMTSTTGPANLMVTNTKFSIHSAAACTPGSTIIESGESQSTECTLDTENMEYSRNYCDGGFWGYNYGTDTTCATASLLSVIYIKAGCLPIGSIFGGGGMTPPSVQSISLGCNTPTKPPSFSLTGGKTAQLSLFADAQCTSQQFGGLYGSVDLCMGNVKVTCSPDGSSATMMMHGATGCTGPSFMNLTFTNSSCVLFPTGPPPAPGTQGPPPQYAKLVNCGVPPTGATVDPATAPGITLSIAPRLSVVFGFVVALVALVWV